MSTFSYCDMVLKDNEASILKDALERNPNSSLIDFKYVFKFMYMQYNLSVPERIVYLLLCKMRFILLCAKIFIEHLTAIERLK